MAGRPTRTRPRTSASCTRGTSPTPTATCGPCSGWIRPVLAAAAEDNMQSPSEAEGARRRWWALYVLCLGVLMIVLDTTIVNVALPSIRTDLKFTETSLVWVVNAYMLTFGGFLLLGGRLGDLFGQRRMFLLGVTLFTLASLACGAASSQGMLIFARAAQGVAGAVVS